MTWIDRPVRSTIIVSVTALVMQLAVLPIRRPLNLPDEAGFLLNAERLGGGGSPSGLDYFPGYSVLLAPIAAVTSDLGAPTVWVQIINGLLLTAAALLAIALARRLQPELGEPTITAIGVVSAAYPAYRLFAAFAPSENLLVPWTVLLCLAFDRALRRSRHIDAALFGLCAGLSLSIHARALGLTIAGVAAGALWIRRRHLLPSAAGVFRGALISLVIPSSLRQWSRRASGGPTSPRRSIEIEP